MKILLLITLSLCTAFAKSQDLKFWYPDGRPYKRVCKNINDINRDFDKLGRIKTFAPFCGDANDCLTRVGYLLFTDKPLYVLAETSDIAKQASEKGYFILNEYLESVDFEMDLDNFIPKKTITEEFILGTFGVPDRRTRSSDGITKIERWGYIRGNTTFTFHNGILHSYTR